MQSFSEKIKFPKEKEYQGDKPKKPRKPDYSKQRKAKRLED